jgi:hypothetical protein
VKNSNAQYESPQVTKTRLATKVYGGNAPSKDEVVKSANAKGGKRHELKGQSVADESVLPKSKQPSVDVAGINNTGYIVKKGTPYGVNAFLNTLPPGMDIEDQEIADIRTQEQVNIVDHRGYPGDGWRD